MKNKIYSEIREVIENYESFNKPSICNAIHDRIYEFDPDTIKYKLKIKLDEVLRDLPHNMRSRNPSLFNVPSHVDHIEMLTEYLLIRYNNPFIFHRIKIPNKYMLNDQINELTVKEFSCLRNRFLDYHDIYIYGTFDKKINICAQKSRALSNPIFLEGASKDRAYAKFSYDLMDEFFQQVSLKENSSKWVFYGKLHFDETLWTNSINVIQFYHD